MTTVGSAGKYWWEIRPVDVKPGDVVLIDDRNMTVDERIYGGSCDNRIGMLSVGTDTRLGAVFVRIETHSKEGQFESRECAAVTLNREQAVSLASQVWGFTLAADGREPRQVVEQSCDHCEATFTVTHPSIDMAASMVQEALSNHFNDAHYQPWDAS
jgi:hypothetical protein